MKLPRALNLKRFLKGFRTGFTLIEILIVITILIMLAGLGLFISIDFYKSYNFNSERDTLVSILQKARSQSLANINEAKHGVYLASSSYVIFQGDNYASRTQTYDEIIQASPTVTRSGLQQVAFEQLTANPSATGTIIMTDGTRSTTISVENEGRINW